MRKKLNIKLSKIFKKKYKHKDIPAKSIFNYIYGQLLRDYLYAKNYDLKNRTGSDSIVSADFRTWAINNFNKEINRAYEKSIENEAVLLKIPLNDYKEIFNLTEHETSLNKSLYDFLTGKYLQSHSYSYYGSDLSEEENSFLKNNIKDLYGETSIFQKIKIEPFVERFFYKKLFFYQKLERSYALQNNSLALSKTILKRVQHIYNNRNDSKEYLDQLEKFTKENNQLRAAFLYEMATVYNKNASKEKHLDYNQKAITICEEIISQKQEPYLLMAKELKRSISQKYLKITTEKYLIPNQPNKALVEFKNADTIYGSLYKIPNEWAYRYDKDRDYDSRREDKNYADRDSLFVDFANKNKAYKTFESILPKKDDYFQYTTEIILPKIEIGSYLLIMNVQKDSITENSEYAYTILNASEMLMAYSWSGKQEKIQVLHRKTGKPIEDVSIKIDSINLKKTNKIGITTNQKADLIARDIKKIQAIFKNDTLTQYHDSYYYSRDDRDKIKIKSKVNLYTDRTIYRPGQNIFFKGILFESKNEKTYTVPDKYVTIVAKNRNDEEVYKAQLKTNEFGSIAGEFQIPKNILIGNVLITASIGEHLNNGMSEFQRSEIYINVEEYKRPKFEIIFEPVKENFIVNQKVKIKGKATAFAGSNISDVKVSYTINRSTYYSDWSYERFHENYNITQIASGETKTDDNGNFEIDFTAIPTENFNPKGLPIFNYRIYASITDVNGETRRSETEVKVGYHSLALALTIPKIINAQVKQPILLNSKNLNEQFIPTDGEIKIYKLKSPNRVLKKRPWAIPEIQTIPENEFVKLFPTDPYKDEDYVENWEKDKLVYTKKINTETTKKITLENLDQWKSGMYVLFFNAKDISGKDIETKSNFNLINNADKEVPDKQLFISGIKNNNPKKDGFIDFYISSPISLLYVDAKAFYDSNSIFDKIIELQGNEKTIRIPIQKDWAKDLKITMRFIWENQNFEEETTISLAENKEKLAIETINLRNKIEPGNSETWSFLIKNQEKKGNVTEVLASMYDASLDQFGKKAWDKDFKFNDYDYNNTPRIEILGIGENTAELKKSRQKHYSFSTERNDLNWFGFNFMGSEQNDLRYQQYLIEKLVLSSSAKTISGVVMENGMPLPGVNVTVSRTERHAQTDYDGKYEIKALFGEILEFKFVGYKEKFIYINNSIIDVDMDAGDEFLNEVIVTGYTATKRKKSLAAVNFTTLEEEDSGFSHFNEYKGNLYGTRADGTPIITTKKSLEALTAVKARKNLSETAFFFPQLRTDDKGNLKFSFTSPEALTQWKLRLFAHNKKAVSGYLENFVITQKDLMVLPNVPRFLRENDTIVITSKISNITSDPKSGIAMLQLFDAATMEPIDAKMLNSDNVKNFNLKANGNTAVSWKLFVPQGLQGVQYKILAKAGDFTDGEENILPVLTNSTLVTESIPLWIPGNTKKEYVFENFKNNQSSTLRNHLLTLEYTSNPAWFAIKSLPYLMEYEHECAEQVFSRYYANTLANEIITTNPKIAAVFDTWKKAGKPISKLEQNEELKSLILAETPWAKDTDSEEQQKKNLALLFDLEKMKTDINDNFEKLDRKQSSSGGFPWFSGGNDNEYITRHIVTGLGHLEKLKISNQNIEKFRRITAKAIPFIDGKFLTRNKNAEINQKKNKIWNYNTYADLHYLYARSFYTNTYPVNDSLKKAILKHLDYTKQHWMEYGLYQKAMATLALHRFGEKETAKKIVTNLKETAINNEENGMYWLSNKAGWYWYQAPIETQALLIEAFSEIGDEKKSVEAMKVWLLKNRQTKSWNTTKATTEAIYALLLQGEDWLSVKESTVIKLGDEKIVTKKLAENEKEAASGYIKMNWKADEITKDMATVSINNKSSIPGYGGFYWQYFENLDKIKSSQDGPLSIEKELYIKENTTKGKELQKITNKKVLKIGDLVTVRLIIYAKDDIDFVHLKDMRAAAFEPVDVLSEYKWQDDLGYYMSTKDAATHFFFDNISKGKYVLEYDIRVNNPGEFSNGITTIQSMYAPEFSSHSKGIRVKIEE
ncbi:alpha-2-macroglobulin family protein [Flavobacterium microcysteis]